MANLIFTLQTDGFYSAEFQADGDFALHIERAEADVLVLQQKSVSNGKYADVQHPGINNNALVIDVDVQGFVAPKWFKVKSKSMPTMAVTVE